MVGGKWIACLVAIGSAAAAAQIASATERRAWTVQDSIAVSYLERSPYGWSSTDAESPIQVSADGSFFFFVRRRGELACDCNVFTLDVYDARRIASLIEQSLEVRIAPDRRVEVQSRANEVGYAGISGARWDDSGSGILFLQAIGDSPPQVARLDLASGVVSVLTDEPLGVRQFDAANGTLLFRALVEKRPRIKFQGYPVVRVEGTDLAELLGFPYDYVFGVRASYRGRPARAIGQDADVTDEFSLSPDGRKALALRWLNPADVPAQWSRYRSVLSRATAEIFRRTGSRSQLGTKHYTVIDLESGTEHPLLDAPIAEFLEYRFDGTRVLWFPSGSRVILANVLLPLSPAVPERASTPYVIDYSIVDGTWRIVARLPVEPLRLQSLSWVRPGESLSAVFAPISGSVGDEPQSHLFRLRHGHWQSSNASKFVEPSAAHRAGALKVEVRESANDPPEVIAVHGGRQVRLYGPDPALESPRRATVVPISWTDRTGRAWSGGLMLPDALRGSHGIPLVILAYDFASDRFLPDGVSTTAFAAQALAARGMAVLQLRRNAPDWSPTQGADFVEGVDSAVEELASRFGIDPARVGLVGFSQSGALVSYAVTHPARTRLAAAIDADGGDPGYMLYVMDELVIPTPIGRFIESFNGGAGRTFWEDKSKWVAAAPGFNLDRVNTPLLLTVNGRHNAFSGLNELCAGLRKLGKPVEYLLFPEGSHELRRPREREASMAATVDWMAFWLTDQEDAGDDKAVQYRRWHEMRERRQQSRTKSTNQSTTE